MKTKSFKKNSSFTGYRMIGENKSSFENNSSESNTTNDMLDILGTESSVHSRKHENNAHVPQTRMQQLFGAPSQFIQPQTMQPQMMQPQLSEQFSDQMMQQQMMQPQQMVPQQMAPQQMVPQQMVPQQMMPQQMMGNQMMQPPQMSDIDPTMINTLAPINNNNNMQMQMASQFGNMASNGDMVNSLRNISQLNNMQMI